MTNKDLIIKAKEALLNAYAPYSNFKVGAALLTENNKVYTGCNIENASFTPTNCAERTAFFKAVSEGESCFEKIAIVGGQNGIITDFISPCGVCRQVMQEFCDDNFIIILAKLENDYVEYKLSDMLPHSFSKSTLEEKYE